MANVNASNGNTNWQTNTTSTNSLNFNGFSIKGTDTLLLAYDENGVIKSKKYSTSGALLNTKSINNINGYILNYKNIDNNAAWLNSSLQNSTNNLNLINYKQGSIISNTILSANYIGSADILDIQDSMYTIVGFYQGSLNANTSIFEESETSNSFILDYNINQLKITSFEMLPYKNIFKTIKIDSNVYYISNYVDGMDGSKRSLSLNENYTNDFKISTTKRKTKNITRNKDKQALLNNTIIKVYPNSNSGYGFNICCLSSNEIKGLRLLNSIGQNISFTSSLNQKETNILPSEKLKAGIYFVENNRQ